MKHYKISISLNNSIVSNFLTKKLVEVNNLSNGQYSFNKNVGLKNSMLRSDLCDYSDVYIVVRGTISVTGTNDANRRNRKLTFKYNVPCISKISNLYKDNAEDVDIVMTMYNLLEHSGSYSMKSWRFSKYYRDEINDEEDEGDANKNIIATNQQQLNLSR